MKTAGSFLATLVHVIVLAATSSLLHIEAAEFPQHDGASTTENTQNYLRILEPKANDRISIGEPVQITVAVTLGAAHRADVNVLEVGVGELSIGSLRISDEPVAAPVFTATVNTDQNSPGHFIVWAKVLTNINEEVYRQEIPFSLYSSDAQAGQQPTADDSDSSMLSNCLLTDSLKSLGCNSNHDCLNGGECLKASAQANGLCRCQSGFYGSFCQSNPSNQSFYTPALDPLSDGITACAEQSRHGKLAAKLSEDIRQSSLIDQSSCKCMDQIKAKANGTESVEVDWESCPLFGSVPLYGPGAQLRFQMRLLSQALSDSDWKKPLFLIPERRAIQQSLFMGPCIPVPEKQLLFAKEVNASRMDSGLSWGGWSSGGYLLNNKYEDMSGGSELSDIQSARGFPREVACVFETLHACGNNAQDDAESLVPLLKSSPNWVSPTDSAPHVPETWRQEVGTLGFRSELTAALFRLRPWAKSVLDQQLSALGFQKPALGVHIRRGDSCAHSEIDPTFRPPCPETEDVFAHIRSMVERYPSIKSIFIATDDDFTATKAKEQLPVLLQQARRSRRSSLSGDSFDINVVVPTFDRSDMFDSGWFIENRISRGSLKPEGVAWSFISDLYGLSQCDFFVLGFASQMSRIGFELALKQRGGVLPPYISMDNYPWCDSPCSFAQTRQGEVLRGIREKTS